MIFYRDERYKRKQCSKWHFKRTNRKPVLQTIIGTYLLLFFKPLEDRFLRYQLLKWLTIGQFLRFLSHSIIHNGHFPIISVHGIQKQEIEFCVSRVEVRVAVSVKATNIYVSYISCRFICSNMNVVRESSKWRRERKRWRYMLRGEMVCEIREGKVMTSPV
jgi:hypothetical protein